VHGWYFPSLGTLTPWSPIEAMRSARPTWSELGALVPELLAVTIVSLISLVTKVSGFEVLRQQAGDLDRELRSHGIGNLIAAPLGGITASLQSGSSRVLEQAGGTTRVSGVVSSLTLGIVALASFDLPGLVPIAVVASLVLYLGYMFIADAVRRPYAQRAWIDLMLAVGIMIVCIRYGYLVGVLAGIVLACLLFAVSYGRVGVVRRHVTRAQFASYVSRSPEASDYLRTEGDAIQVYWLSGYIFFGSSEGVYERIRRDIEALKRRRVAAVVLDFGMVSGADTSAIMSLIKLRNYCDQHGAAVVCCSLSPAAQRALKQGGFYGGKSKSQVFADVNHALAWSEDRLLERSGLGAETGLARFEPWLQHQLGADIAVADLIAYLQHKHTDGSQVLYRQGEPADTVDIIAAGDLVIDIAVDGGESLRVRRIATHSVVGEMGFFRQAARSATVSSDGPATIFSLTRGSFERMRRERPDLADAFADFIVRILADRVESANRAVAALSR
jgi:SulP family sulfate permease